MLLRSRALTGAALLMSVSCEGSVGIHPVPPGSEPCEVLAVEYKHLGPPDGGPDLTVTAGSISAMRLPAGTGTPEPRTAAIEAEDWRTLQRVACAEADRPVATKSPQDPISVGGNRLLRIRTTTRNFGGNLRHEDLDRVPVMAELDDLSRSYFGEPLYVEGRPVGSSPGDDR